ncbi:MAG: hypothetical protein U0894_10850 [Pirellulales bacterium]
MSWRVKAFSLIDQVATAVESPLRAGQDFEGLGRLNGGDDLDDGGQNAAGIAGGRGAGRRWLAHDAAEAKRVLPGMMVRDCPSAPMPSAVNRARASRASFKESRLEVVGTIEDQIDPFAKLTHVAAYIGHMGIDRDAGIDLAEVMLGSDRFWKARRHPLRCRAPAAAELLAQRI